MNKKGQGNRLRTRTFLWLSHLQVSDPSWEVLLWRSLQPLKITWTLSLKETILSYYQSTKIFCEPWKGSFVITDNISFEKNLRLTVKIFQFLRPHSIQVTTSYPSQFALSELPEEAWNRIFPTSLTCDVTSEIAEDDWERGCTSDSYLKSVRA